MLETYGHRETNYDAIVTFQSVVYFWCRQVKVLERYLESLFIPISFEKNMKSIANNPFVVTDSEIKSTWIYFKNVWKQL